MNDNSAEAVLLRVLNQLKADIIASHRANGQVVTGQTIEGYEVVVEGHIGARGWLGGYEYVGALQDGRKAGKVPAYFEEIIKRWIIAKGLDFTDEADLLRFARAIVWKIKREGSFLHRNPSDRPDIFTANIEKMTVSLQQGISRFYETEVVNEIFKK